LVDDAGGTLQTQWDHDRAVNKANEITGLTQRTGNWVAPAYDAWNRLVEALGEFCPDAQWQRCVVHFYRNVFTAVPKGKAREVSAILKAIHAQPGRAGIDAPLLAAT